MDIDVVGHAARRRGGAVREPGDGTSAPGRPAAGNRSRSDQASSVAEDLRITLLGGFRVSVGAREIHDSEWYLRKAKNLLKLLVLAPDLSLHRGQIVEILWPEFEEAAATNNLHKAIHTVRRVLEPDLPAKTGSSFLHMNGDFVYLQSSAPLHVDVKTFLEAARKAEASNDSARYRHAIDLYGGELLPEDRYEDWTFREREEVQDAYIGLLLGLSELQELAGDLENAIELLRQAVRVDRANEDAHTALMRLLAVSGLRQQALRQYKALRDALREELEAEPRASTRELYDQILREDVQVLLTPKGAESQSVENSAPRATPGLIGRESEVALGIGTLQELIRGRGSTLLITGEVGAGKSRLVSALERIATEQDIIVLQGAASTDWSIVPFWPFRVALEGFAQRVPPDVLCQLAGPHAGVLSAISPTFQIACLQGTSSSQAPGLNDLSDALVSFIERLSGAAPVLLVFENLHAADESTLLVVERLCSLVARLPVLLLGTIRSSDMSIQAFDRLSRHAQVLRLNPLHADDVAKLVREALGGEVDSGVIDVILRLAGGNPYYADEAVQALRGRGRIHQVDGVWRLREQRAIPWGRDNLRRLDGTASDARLLRKLRSS